ncbi:ABC transporter permease [Desulfobulbus alkaliphilus]|uniref:ABC transporter permease n=1 Tax=Desulfobulbus alkaliphilus TaxID=869814 RepID=UPI0019661B38|nr:ABC transporter permease [Desulfobulbus alkaliphilus]MBM9537674.1 ABC transporter permease [Desulfobulbus alkaliphilus]
MNQATIGYRVFQAFLVAFLVGLGTFIMVRVLPGDLAYRIAAGRYGYDLVDSVAAEAVRLELGLDGSPILAFLSWFWDLIRFDLGYSLVTGELVRDAIFHELGHSVDLAATALILSLFIGPPLGLLAGFRPGSIIDRLVLASSVVFRSIPHFAIGLVLIMIFSIQAGLLPVAGHGHPLSRVLPALTLALGLAAVSSRIARDAMIKVRESDYYLFGRTKGLSESQVFFRHGLRNVSVPIITYLGMQFVYLIEGVVVVETLFAWPGIGHSLVHAIVARDIPMIQGTAFVMGLMFVFLNALVDFLNRLVDPRERVV